MENRIVAVRNKMELIWYIIRTKELSDETVKAIFRYSLVWVITAISITIGMNIWGIPEMGGIRESYEWKYKYDRYYYSLSINEQYKEDFETWKEGVDILLNK